MPSQNFINGAWVAAHSGNIDAVINPATGDVIAEVPSSDAADIDAAVPGAGPEGGASSVPRRECPDLSHPAPGPFTGP